MSVFYDLSSWMVRHTRKLDLKITKQHQTSTLQRDWRFFEMALDVSAVLLLTAGACWSDVCFPPKLPIPSFSSGRILMAGMFCVIERQNADASLLLLSKISEFSSFTEYLHSSSSARRRQWAEVTTRPFPLIHFCDDAFWFSFAFGNESNW